VQTMPTHLSVAKTAKKLGVFEVFWSNLWSVPP